MGFHVGAEIASQGEAFVAQFAGVRLVTCRPINQSGYYVRWRPQRRRRERRHSTYMKSKTGFFDISKTLQNSIHSLNTHTQKLSWGQIKSTPVVTERERGKANNSSSNFLEHAPKFKLDCRSRENNVKTVRTYFQCDSIPNGWWLLFYKSCWAFQIDVHRVLNK